jgi:hypothetical protein
MGPPSEWRSGVSPTPPGAGRPTLSGPAAGTQIAFSASRRIVLMTSRVRIGLTLASLLFAIPAAAKKPDCSASVATVQAAVTAACDCAAAKAHGQYVRCAGRVVKGLAADGTIARSCKGQMVRGFARSTCGKREGVVTCCGTRGSRTVCGVKKATVCERRGGTVGATSMCLDACLPSSPSGAFLD